MAIKPKKPLTSIPELTPFRKGIAKGKFAATLSPEDYFNLWEKIVEEAKATGNYTDDLWDAFEKTHGELIVNGRKLKPSKIKNKVTGTWWKGGSLTDIADKGQDIRKWRGALATYMFGGIPMTTEQAPKFLLPSTKGKTEFGDVLEAHHKFGNAELAPWFDDIIEYLQDPDPRVRARGRAMMEAGKEYFKDSPYKLGNVLENYELLVKPRHTGGLKGGKVEAPWESVHGQAGTGSQGKVARDMHSADPFIDEDGFVYKGDPGDRLTGKGGMSPWSNDSDFVKKLRNLGWRRGDVFIDPKHTIGGEWIKNRSKMNRWSTLEDMLTWQMPIKEEGFEKVKYNRGLDTPNERTALARLQAGIPDINLDASVVRNLGAATSGLSTTDAALNLGVGVATGNYLQAAGGGAGLVLQSSAAQKAIAKQIAKRGAKSTLKLIPGVDVVLSGAEAWGYLSEGKFDQAGIAALSGAIGWVPIIGDAAAAGLDITNTGLDIARMDLNNRGELDDPKKKNVNIDIDYKSKNTWNSIYRNIRF